MMLVRRVVTFLAVVGAVLIAGGQNNGPYPPMLNLNPGSIQLGRGGASIYAPYGIPPYGYPIDYFAPQRNIVPRESESLSAEILKDGSLQVSWSGPTDFVSGAYIAILDKNKGELLRQRFEAPPVTLTKAPPKGAAYYRVVITYVNGSATNVTSPIPAPVEKSDKDKKVGQKDAKADPPKADQSGLSGP
jgi:hypothetical protein